jgi:hypothetical protein
MIENPHEITAQSSHREENWRLRSFLKAFPRKRAKFNRLAAQTGRAIEAEMNCCTCAACCQDNCIPLNKEEIERLAGCMNMSVERFIEQFMTTDPDGEPALAAMPCPFLLDNECSIYTARPEACRGYPYIGGDIVEGMVGYIERAENCPIVFNMLERLKDQLNFRRLHGS